VRDRCPRDGVSPVTKALWQSIRPLAAWPHVRRRTICFQTVVDPREPKLWEVKLWRRGLLYTPVHRYHYMVIPTFQKVCVTPLCIIRDPCWYLLSLTERKPKTIFHLYEKLITTQMEVFRKSIVAYGMRQTWKAGGTLRFRLLQVIGTLHFWIVGETWITAQLFFPQY